MSAIRHNDTEGWPKSYRERGVDLQGLEERKKLQLETIEKQKAANIKIKDGYCFCQKCHGKIKPTIKLLRKIFDSIYRL